MAALTVLIHQTRVEIVVYPAVISLLGSTIVQQIVINLQRGRRVVALKATNTTTPRIAVMVRGIGRFYHRIYSILAKYLPSVHYFSDINECLLKEDYCEHHCINTDGSYICKCNEGYMLEHEYDCKAKGNTPRQYADYRISGGIVALPKDCHLYWWSVSSHRHRLIRERSE